MLSSRTVYTTRVLISGKKAELLSSHSPKNSLSCVFSVLTWCLLLVFKVVFPGWRSAVAAEGNAQEGVNVDARPGQCKVVLPWEERQLRRLTLLRAHCRLCQRHALSRGVPSLPQSRFRPSTGFPAEKRQPPMAAAVMWRGRPGAAVGREEK